MIVEHLKTSKNILLATHIRPDGDALGSMIAMGLALAAYGKSITLYNESKTPAGYRFLPSIEWIEHHIDREALERYDTLIILDCGNIHRIGKLATEVERRIPIIINIDHHISNTGFGSFQHIDPEACSTAEIIYGLIKKMGIEITKDMAVGIYTGILTDTGSFRFSNTNKAAFAICHEMIDRGVDPSSVAENVFGSYSLERIKLLNKVLDSIEISENGKISIMILTQSMIQDTGARSVSDNDISNFINYATHIEDVKIAALIREGEHGNSRPDTPNPFHISLRSDGRIDVSTIASAFGGGGHMNAAGFTIVSTLAGIKRKILSMATRL
jgi:phosphoesterase RecJ-like protein